MNEDALQSAMAAGKVEIVPPQVADEPIPPTPFNVEDYVAILELLRRMSHTYTTPPTSTPKSFADSIKFYDDGVARRLYIYVNKTWRYIALT